MDEMELNILARRDVRYAVGVFLGKISEGFKLRGVQPAERNLDAHHAGRVPQRVRPFDDASRQLELLNALAVVSLSVVVTLAVDAAPQARLGENFLVDLALLAQLHLLLEDIDLAPELFRDPRRELVFPVEHLFHSHLLS